MSFPRSRFPRGKVQCGKLPYFRGDGDKTHPKINGYKNINVCTGQAKTSIWRQLSPMELGSIEFDELLPSGEIVHRVVTNLENLWQASKVWKGEIDGDVPSKEWWERREKIWSDEKAHRRIKKGKPLFSWWNNEKLNYDEARRKIYIPLYIKYIIQTEAYKRLEKMVDDGQDTHIIGYDGRKFDCLWKELKDLSKPFGHELVLCCLLRKEFVWDWRVNKNGFLVDENGKIVIRFEDESDEE